MSAGDLNAEAECIEDTLEDVELRRLLARLDLMYGANAYARRESDLVLTQVLLMPGAANFLGKKDGEALSMHDRAYYRREADDESIVCAIVHTPGVLPSSGHLICTFVHQPG